ncbi:MAG: UDP-N-acetylmuramyl-tripeptide synthetase, partial [Spirochaetota bacterium]
DGKSTTVYLIHQLLECFGKTSGFLSTVQYKTGDILIKNPFRQSTPEAPEVHAILKEMADNKKEYAVIEATSHGLSEKNNRLGDVHFCAGVFTNISHEHLEFHGTFRQYLNDKANLFRYLDKIPSNRQPFGVVNRDDPNASFFYQATQQPVYSYSTCDSSADLYAYDIHPWVTGNSFRIKYNKKDIKARINLPGIFNVENTLAAVLTVIKLLGVSIGDTAGFLPALQPVSGRMKTVDCGQDFTVIIDYAHTPGAFSKLFPGIRPQVKGRLIAVFGSAGERDIEKRSLLGRIADRYSDIIILADEDPRGEDSKEILKQIASGCTTKEDGKTLFLIPDRLAAIKQALAFARTGDMVLLLGKGHEASIIYKDGPRPWDELSAATVCLEKLKIVRCNAGI